MMRPFYAKQPATRSAVMAEQNDDGTWSVQGSSYGREDIPDDIFREMYTDQSPHNYLKLDGSGEHIDPVALADAGTHDLVYCVTKEHLDEIAEEHPGTWFLSMNSGGAQKRAQMPSVWVGWVNPGEDLMKEENAIYGFPLLAVIPKN